MGRFWDEISETFWDRVGPQGSSEIVHGLYGGNAYTPYGVVNRELHAGVEPESEFDPSKYAGPTQERDDDLVME